MKFAVVINRADGSYKSTVTLDSEIDRVEGTSVTSLSLAEEYARKYLINDGDYCLAMKH